LDFRATFVKAQNPFFISSFTLQFPFLLEYYRFPLPEIRFLFLFLDHQNQRYANIIGYLEGERQRGYAGGGSVSASGGKQ